MKFTITQMLYGMVVAALIAAMIGAGTNGSPLAYGLGVSVCMLVLYFLFFAILYWGTILCFGRRKPPAYDPSTNKADQEPGV